MTGFKPATPNIGATTDIFVEIPAKRTKGLPPLRTSLCDWQRNARFVTHLVNHGTGRYPHPRGTQDLKSTDKWDKTGVKTPV
jgi:hypothetical protein